MAEQAVNGVLRVVGFAGSLRRGSFNRALLDAARQLAPRRMSISPIEIGDLPFYNADVEAEGDPAAVVEFKAAIRAADGILIATAEFNDGIPGVLTTAIDWSSRPAGAVCETIKDKQRNGGRDFAALITPVSEDKLVLWGWNPGGERSPVSVPHDQFVARFKEWAAAGGPCPSD